MQCRSLVGVVAKKKQPKKSAKSAAVPKERFEPKEFVATGDKVVALGHYTATTPIKKGLDSDFAMVFTLSGSVRRAIFSRECLSATFGKHGAAGGNRRRTPA